MGFIFALTVDNCNASAFFLNSVETTTTTTTTTTTMVTMTISWLGNEVCLCYQIPSTTTKTVYISWKVNA